MPNNPWSDAEVALVQAHIDEGDRAISERLATAGHNRAPRAVEAFRKMVLGIVRTGPISSWTYQRVETLLARYAEGYSASQIAKELGGITRNAVCGKLNRLEVIQPSREAASKKLGRAPQRLAERRSRPPGPSGEARAFQFGFGVRSGVRTAPRRVDASVSLPLSLSLHMWDDAFKFRCCKWSTGEDEHGYLFCGAPVARGVPYCPGHARLAFNPTSGAPSAPRADRTAKAEPKDEPDPQPLDFERAA